MWKAQGEEGETFMVFGKHFFLRTDAVAAIEVEVGMTRSTMSMAIEP
jgi:hypothetical protein